VVVNVRTFTDADDPARNRVLVTVADHESSSDGQTLVAYGLGACVAVALYDPSASIGALAHAMLPERPPDAGGATGTFVDEVTETMTRELISEGASYGDLRAALVGGATIFELPGIDTKVGSRTVEMARERLSELGIPVVAEAVGGTVGRTASFDTATGVVTVETARHGDHEFPLTD
jgi:chemotaxis protein CheD